MYKNTLILATTICALAVSNAFADDSSFSKGAYIGAQMGESKMNYADTSYTRNSTGSNNDVDDKKGAMRIFGGYNFTQYLAGELGYGYYGRPEFQHPSGNTQDLVQQGVDGDLRINIPLNYGLGIYGKGGLMWVHRGALESRGGTFADKDASSKITTLGGVGLSYDVNQKWGADLSWTRTQENGDLPKMDFYAFGITYKFNSDS